ncbi:gamma-mobile-trio protein GmtX [Muricoccus nepalensis]|uniref:gamma-mobile-trio protein GmtX n=1 Tax=Muricoccus nepalensis TaxID=1854500 RepID=UPI0038D06F72
MTFRRRRPGDPPVAAERFDVVLRKVFAESGERRRHTIDGLVAVLKTLKAKNNRTYTVAIVGRACQEAGVLNTQSIRNASGAPFRTLIEAFAQEVGAAPLTHLLSGRRHSRRRSQPSRTRTSALVFARSWLRRRPSGTSEMPSRLHSSE